MEQKKLGLVIDLEAENPDFWVDGGHPAFDGTPFEGQPFRVHCKCLSRTEIAALQRKVSKSVRGNTRTDDTAFGIEVFNASVLEWEGIGDKNGEPLPCNETTKRGLANKYWGLASVISAAVLDEQNQRAVAKDEEQKN